MCAGSDSRTQRTVPSGELEMHSIGAIRPSSASTTSAIVICAGSRARRYPPRAPRRLLDQAGAAQACDEMLEVGERQSLGLGDLGERNRLRATAPRKVDHDPHAVLSFGGEDHRSKAYLSGRVSRVDGRPDWPIVGVAATMSLRDSYMDGLPVRMDGLPVRRYTL